MMVNVPGPIHSRGGGQAGVKEKRKSTILHRHDLESVKVATYEL